MQESDVEMVAAAEDTQNKSNWVQQGLPAQNIQSSVWKALKIIVKCTKPNLYF